MTSLLENLRDRVSSLTGPTAHRLRGPAFDDWLRKRPTSDALESLRVDEQLREEMTARDQTTREAVEARRLTAAKKEWDKGKRSPEPELDEDAREWKAHLAWLDGTATDLGLAGRGQIAEHLTVRRRSLETHLTARYRAEGEPVALKNLRAELSQLIAQQWEQARRWRELSKGYNARGGASAGNEQAEAELVALREEQAKVDAQVMTIRRQLSITWAVE